MSLPRPDRSIRYRVLWPEERTGIREKYEVDGAWSIQTIVVGHELTHDYYSLDPDGLVTLYDGYRWDGKSGPGVDTAISMSATAVHDLGYQLEREGLLTGRRAVWDAEFRRILEMFGSGWLERNADYWAVRIFGRWHNRRKYKA